MKKKWEFDSLLEVNGIMRQVWTCPSNLFENETFYAITFDFGKGENPPTSTQGYWAHLKSFQKSCPTYRQ